QHSRRCDVSKLTERAHSVIPGSSVGPRRNDGAYVFGNFAFSAYSASSASRGVISSGCSAFTAAINCSASLGSAASAAAREGTEAALPSEAEQLIAAVK